jgi:Ca-activated chloride channel family protein
VSFAAPGLLVALAVVPVAVAGYLLLERRRDSRAAAWASPALLPNMVDRPPAWRRRLPVGLLLAGMTLLLVGFARPTVRHMVKRQQATVVVVIDVSGSMAAGDARPNRLTVAKTIAYELAARLPHGYRMAVVTFSDHAAVVAPPTDDLGRIRAAIAAAHTGPQGTALGEAVFHAVDVVRAVPAGQGGKRPPAAILVLSDGGATAGRTSPQQAASRAANAKVPVFAVAIGTPTGVVHQALKGGYQERIDVPVQPVALDFFARSTGGRFFAGAQAFDPAAILRNLGSRSGTRRATVEVTAAAAGGGIAFMLVGAALSGLWFRRLT